MDNTPQYCKTILKIEITQPHIDTGKARNVFDCAIAEAFKQEFAYDIKVSDLILIGKDYFQVADEVTRWIADFDKGRAVKPITIKIVSYEEAESYQPKTSRQKDRQPIDTCGKVQISTEPVT